LLELKRPFEFKLVRIENVKLGHDASDESPSSNSSTSYLYLEAGLYHGGELLSPVVYSQSVPTSENPTWIEWLRFETLMCDLPKVRFVCRVACRVACACRVCVCGGVRAVFL
jgi:hypothetical protein